MSSHSSRSISSVGSIDSVSSVGSILSVGSAGSLLSIGSTGSILGRYSHGGLLRDGDDALTGRALAVHVATIVGVGVAVGIIVAATGRLVRRWA